MMSSYSLGSKPLDELISQYPLTALDIGARGGFSPDLDHIASAVEGHGFEPELVECARLNESANRYPYRSLRFHPYAVGEPNTNRTFYRYRAPGCSSLLEGDKAIARGFSRGDYFHLEGQDHISTIPLPEALHQGNIGHPQFLKIDIQGAELEVLRTASDIIRDAVLVIRVEVEFLPIYRNQPLFHDVDAFLQRAGFELMDLLEEHHWRRMTRESNLQFTRKAPPYSRGQLVHADALYFRNPYEVLRGECLEKKVQAAGIALAYGFIDHAALLLDNNIIKRTLEEEFCTTLSRELINVSRRMAFQRLRTSLNYSASRVKKVMRSLG